MKQYVLPPVPMYRQQQVTYELPHTHNGPDVQTATGHVQTAVRMYVFTMDAVYQLSTFSLKVSGTCHLWGADTAELQSLV